MTNVTDTDIPPKYKQVFASGNITEQAEETYGAIAIAIMDMLWLAWIVVSMTLSWQNVENGASNSPITYIWQLTGDAAMPISWLPIGYFFSWIINFLIFGLELIAWFVSGEFFLLYVHVGLFGGLIFGLFPVFFEIFYIVGEPAW